MGRKVQHPRITIVRTAVNIYVQANAVFYAVLYLHDCWLNKIDLLNGLHPVFYYLVVAFYASDILDASGEPLNFNLVEYLSVLFTSCSR